jgi:hypothetical protein
MLTPQRSAVNTIHRRPSGPEGGKNLAQGATSCEKIGCHAERSEASAFIFLKTNNCRFFAALRMTGIVNFFTASKP